jgi:hypothetical protein
MSTLLPAPTSTAILSGKSIGYPRSFQLSKAAAVKQKNPHQAAAAPEVVNRGLTSLGIPRQVWQQD